MVFLWIKCKVPSKFCPVIGSGPNPLGLPPRQRVVNHIIFLNADVCQFDIDFVCRDDIEIIARLTCVFKMPVKQ
jgi:hypothetical protein